MIGISSRSAGILLLPKSGTSEYTFLDVVEGKEKDPVEAQYLYSAAQDWEKLEGSDKKKLLEIASHEYWLARAVSLLREVIVGLEISIEKRVLEHVEELLSTRVSSEETLNHLLIAPLVNSNSLETPVGSALNLGCTAVGSILDELKELQPLLRRFTDLWLSLDEAVFSDFLEPREMIWVTVVEKFGIKRLLKAESRQVFTGQWNLLAFHFTNP